MIRVEAAGARQQSRRVVLADEHVGSLHELPLRDVGRQVLTLELEELREERLMGAMEQLQPRT